MMTETGYDGELHCSTGRARAAGLGYLTKIDTALSRFRLCGPDFFAFHLDAKAKNIAGGMNGSARHGCVFAAKPQLRPSSTFSGWGY